MTLTKTPPQDLLTLEIPITQDGLPAIEWLSSHCPLSKQRLKDTMTKGAVWLKRATIKHGPPSSNKNDSHKDKNKEKESNETEQGETTEKQRSTQNAQLQRIRRASKILQRGETLFLYYNEKVLQQQPPAATLIDENNHYSVWYKPSGLFSHGSKWGDHCSITRWVEQNHQPQRTTFLIHRLDRASSGLILIAHDKKTAAALAMLFEQRHIDKYYHAIVTGHYPDTEQVVELTIDGKSARTIINTVGYNPQKNISLVNAKIETGRKHQIRRHLSETGFPIIGDRLYGSQIFSQTDTQTTSLQTAHHIDTIVDLQLRAYHLSFICPITHEKRIFTLDKNLLLPF